MSFAWFIVRLLAVTVAFAALHGYVWWRLCRDTTRPGSVWRPVGAVALGILAALGLLARSFAPSGAPMWFQEAVGWPGWIWFGIFMYLFGLLVVAEPLRWFLLRRKKAETGEPSANTDPAATATTASTPPTRTPRSAPAPADRRTLASLLQRGALRRDTPDPGGRIPPPTADPDTEAADSAGATGFPDASSSPAPSG